MLRCLRTAALAVAVSAAARVGAAWSEFSRTRFTWDRGHEDACADSSLNTHQETSSRRRAFVARSLSQTRGLSLPVHIRISQDSAPMIFVIID